MEVNDIGLGKSIYTREQLDKFARFQDSHGTRKAYLAETAELAYRGRTGDGEWGLGLSTAAQGSIIDIVGASFSLCIAWWGQWYSLSLSCCWFGGFSG